jgi:hypothetical protein
MQPAAEHKTSGGGETDRPEVLLSRSLLLAEPNQKHLLKSIVGTS